MEKIYYCLLLLSLLACKNQPATTKTEKIAALMEEAFAEKKFVGNVLVADQGQVIFRQSYGRAATQTGRNNTDSTRFLLASVSKPITAILMLRLADQQKLRLTDSLHAFFPITNAQTANITIHQLLTHTSGIKEIISKNAAFTIASLNEKDVLLSPPGARFEYCNSGYVILKAVAEAVTGSSYAQLIQTEICIPAHMTATGVARNNQLADIACGYKNATQTQSAALDFQLEQVDGAGSLYATTGDLYRLDSALYTNTLLSENGKQEMLKQQVPEKFSYGWYVRERGGKWDVYWHKGNFAGSSCMISRRLQKHQFIALLSNAENVDVASLENAIARILKSTD